MNLGVDGAVTAGEGGFAHSLAIGGVGVASQRQILRRGTEFHRNANLVDQIARARADDMRAKDTVGRGIGEDFDKAFGLKHRFGAGVALSLIHI